MVFHFVNLKKERRKNDIRYQECMSRLHNVRKKETTNIWTEGCVGVGAARSFKKGVLERNSNVKKKKKRPTSRSTRRVVVNVKKTVTINTDIHVTRKK